MTQAFRAHQAKGSGDSPEHRAFVEPVAKRVRVVFGGEVVADSGRVLLMHETGHLPIYYFPLEDVRADLLEPTDHTSH